MAAMADEEPEVWSSCKFSDRAQDKEKCGHLSVVQRYYTPRYKLGFGEGNDEDHCVLTHSNKVCLITLAPSHPILRDKKTVTDVNYQVNDTTNRLTNKVEGKSKKGAHDVHAKSWLCCMTCSDGARYTVRACMKGQIVEVNGRLVTEPHLVTQKPQTEGHVAILLCKLKDYQTEMSRLSTEEQYQEQLTARSQPVTDSQPETYPQPTTNSQPETNSQPTTNSQPETNSQPMTKSQSATNSQPETNLQPATNSQPMDSS